MVPGPSVCAVVTAIGGGDERLLDWGATSKCAIWGAGLVRLIGGRMATRFWWLSLRMLGRGPPDAPVEERILLQVQQSPQEVYQVSEECAAVCGSLCGSIEECSGGSPWLRGGGPRLQRVRGERRSAEGGEGAECGVRSGGPAGSGEERGAASGERSGAQVARRWGDLARREPWGWRPGGVPSLARVRRGEDEASSAWGQRGVRRVGPACGSCRGGARTATDSAPSRRWGLTGGGSRERAGAEW